MRRWQQHQLRTTNNTTLNTAWLHVYAICADYTISHLDSRCTTIFYRRSCFVWHPLYDDIRLSLSFFFLFFFFYCSVTKLLLSYGIHCSLRSIRLLYSNKSIKHQSNKDSNLRTSISNQKSLDLLFEFNGASLSSDNWLRDYGQNTLQATCKAQV